MLEKCGFWTCFIFQLLLWISTCVTCWIIINDIKSINSRNRNTPLILSLSFNIILYLSYFILNFYSKHWYYLSNYNDKNQLDKYISDMFYQPPRITWNAECYHYYTSGYGKNRRRRKKVTYTEKRNLNFYTWRDISGPFHLDAERVKNSSIKKYIMLDTKTDFEFADDMTKYDYQTNKDNFYNSVKNRDEYLNFQEERDMEGFFRYKMIRISNNDALFFNRCWFVIFLLLGIIEIFKCYINLFCSTQNFIFKKVLSTRYDLNQNTHNNYAQYISMNPSITILRQPTMKIDFTPEPLYNNPGLPTMEEINFAKKITKEINFNDYSKNNEYKPYFNNEQIVSNPDNNISHDSHINLNFSNIELENKNNKLEQKLI